MKRKEQILNEGWEFTLKEPVDESFKPVCLPHDWAVRAPINREMEEGGPQGFFDRWGIGWYRRLIEINEIKEDRDYYLGFGAIYEDCTIWINGKEAGGYRYGYSPFRINITPFIIEGSNQILIRVNNTGHPADRWYSGCGIYRTVKLLELPKRRLEAEDCIVITSVKENTGIVQITVNEKQSVKALLFDGDKVVAQKTEAGNSIILEVINPQLWSAGNPHLYRLALQLLDHDEVVDEITLRVGIREFSFTPEHGMLVNSRPVKLKGVCLHQDVGCLGVAATKEMYRTRLSVLKEMGCNTIRTAHHIFSEEFLDLCDEMGFYVYEEPFDKWTGGHYGRYFETDWQKDVGAMVKRDRNRTCVCIWGVGNEVENQGQDSMLEILKKLVNYVKAMDSSRPVTYAMNPHFKFPSNVNMDEITDIQKFVDEEDDTEIYDAVERVKRIKRIAASVDILSCNYQEQWYELIHQMIPDKLILGTEVFQYFQGHYDQMQNFSMKNPLLVPERLPYVIGSMIWSGYDYLGESMGYPAKGWGGALVRTNHEKRPGYYVAQSYWSQEPMVRFLVMDYSMPDEVVKEHWDIPPYEEHWYFPQFYRMLVPYMIPTNCEEVKLFLNGKEYHLPRPDQFEDRVIRGFLPYQPGCVEVHGYKNGEKVCLHVVKTPKQAVQLTFDREEYFLPGDSKQLMLMVRAVDREGVLCFRESAKIRFCLEGDAELIGVDNGDLTNQEAYRGDTVHLHHGCASVVVQLKKHGRAVLRAYGQGLSYASVVLIR